MNERHVSWIQTRVLHAHARVAFDNLDLIYFNPFQLCSDCCQLTRWSDAARQASMFGFTRTPSLPTTNALRADAGGKKIATIGSYKTANDSSDRPTRG